jgi:tetratricopeptide (TPR) repeat protein
MSRARAYKSKGDYDRAIADYTKAIEIEPKDTYAYRYRSEIYLERRDYDLAIADLGKLIELSPNDASPYMSRARAYKSKGDYDRAIAEYSKALEIDPSRGHIYRGGVFNLTGDYDRAIADLTIGIENLEKLVSAKQTKDPPLGIDAFIGALRRFNARWELLLGYRERGDSYVAKGDHDRAIADYTKAVELVPADGNGAAHARRARAYLKAGKAAEGLPDAQTAIERSPRYAWGLETRGLIFEALGRKQEAIADFREALKINPSLAPSMEALKRLGAGP